MHNKEKKYEIIEKDFAGEVEKYTNYELNMLHDEKWEGVEKWKMHMRHLDNYDFYVIDSRNE